MTYTLDAKPNYNDSYSQSLYQPYGFRRGSLKPYLYPIPLGTPEGVPYHLTDDVWIYWKFVENPSARMYSYDKFLCESWISFDRGLTKTYGFFDYNFYRLHPQTWDKFLEVWLPVKKKRQSNMSKVRAAERRAALACEAMALGIEDTESYVNQKLLEKKEEIKREKETSKVKRSVEETEKLMRLSTTLRTIEAQIESLRQKITDENSVVRLGYFSRNTYKLDVALDVLKYMNGN